jgi:hypothetical protein
MSKFLPNLLLQISKALVYSKIKFFIRKRIFLHFRPNRPSGQPAQARPPCFPTGRSPSPHWASASRPAQLTVSAQPTTRRWRPARLPPPIRENVFLENCLPFTNAYSQKICHLRSAHISRSGHNPHPALVGRPKPPSPPPRPTGFIARSAQAAHLATRVFFLLRTKATRPPPPLRATTAPPCATAPASPPP